MQAQPIPQNLDTVQPLLNQLRQSRNGIPLRVLPLMMAVLKPSPGENSHPLSRSRREVRDMNIRTASNGLLHGGVGADTAAPARGHERQLHDAETGFLAGGRARVANGPDEKRADENEVIIILDLGGGSAGKITRDHGGVFLSLLDSLKLSPNSTLIRFSTLRISVPDHKVDLLHLLVEAIQSPLEVNDGSLLLRDQSVENMTSRL
ncbi:hypothetical protein HG530_012445 [Fusarium avenaceum]|nr:hypothetical protein HG530_012445 [Fusarium avenaceum]